MNALLDSAKKRILIAGDVMLDRYWFGEVNRISPEAPVPVVRVQRREERLGGASNVALNVAALGVTTSLLGVIGEDEAGDAIEAMLKKSGITSYLSRDREISTIIKLRVIGRQQQLIRIDFEERPTAHVLSDKLNRYNALLTTCDVVVLSDYAKGGLVNVAAMISGATAAGKLILVDPKGSDFSRYRGASLLTPNKSELRQIVGEWDSEAELTEKAQAMRTDLGLQGLLLTRSEEGMTLYTEAAVTHVPTMAREVFDVSGAGDTVIATMAVMMAQGMSMEQSVVIANRAAGIVVGKLGTATVSQQELFPAQ
ncbi:D-glycero-beta-D-manno-heptose-7-phosphate kinase [Undibacterium sp. CCC2.1]|uniref:D-glycero-beta-D-manno-heptose-7-phosphate kinase n=2 Tax=Undibacterium TaxID=401469 RepID=UPI002B238BD9|nr:MULTISPECIES: D-glycero-beta-D-manno-heptose-7-phosphate kinase [unclassified Undibacterium]MEB0139563.1 D-glycero-beta-D-manno-heptose-7-phosphate kinase [Undibacterium sp. CCC2.1]MEB0172506.1 D-glycero-beta-D-manno-heptose-7-phosphate kinase [Undibacterium sp. CCC1.1]MEB0176524.1 D-glycero-beta-D-manno-heptose-7-phosphate kinase [Undibacterium sp. CCC3.4]MEB0215622.1 D-glycero-beta-D-manno-heptose-7-phosphate kinase [Undibacterium sp. 5I2]